MKRRWANLVKDYLTFTKRERIGILLTFVIIGGLIFIYPRLTSPDNKPLNTDSFNKDLAQLKITIDSSSKQYKNYSNNDDDFASGGPRRFYSPSERMPKGELFEFNPNTLDAEGWKRLGVKDRTVQTIQKLVSKGFKFRQPEDIKRIYGLYPDQAERLVPYVRIQAPASPAANASLPYTATTSNNFKKPEFKPRVIDVNTADTNAYKSLPGIGSKLSARIVNFREKLGGFVSVEQVGETYGVPDSTFQKIKPLLRCNHPSVKTININAADVNELKTNPYIKWNIANAIVAYKKQHGDFKSLEDLKKINIISEELFNKIAPYLKVSG